MKSLAAHGLALGLPAGWEGRIQRRGTTVAAEQTNAVVTSRTSRFPNRATTSVVV